MDAIYFDHIIKPFAGEGREECPICIDNDQFTFKSWVKLRNCSHYFHRHCIDLWLEHKSTCPICVQDTTPSVTFSMESSSPSSSPSSRPSVHDDYTNYIPTRNYDNCNWPRVLCFTVMSVALISLVLLLCFR
jgi:hypothetical protein